MMRNRTAAFASRIDPHESVTSLDPHRTTRFRWRRTALYRPVLLVADTTSTQHQMERQSILRSCHVGMRAILRREGGSSDGVAVYVRVEGERRIGNLPRRLALGLAHKLDSDQIVLEAEIWLLDRVDTEQGLEEPACWLLIKEFEFAPIQPDSPVKILWRKLRAFC
jgi:hypothetical protein